VTATGRLFNRVAQCTIGPKGQSGLFVDQLRIKFRVEQTADRQANKARVEIFNLSKASREGIERPGNYLILFAGYASDSEKGRQVGRIFEGDIPEGGVLTSRQGPDVVTTIEAGDGLTQLNKASVDLSFSPGANIKDVVGSLASSLGFASGPQEGLRDETYLNGFIASGRSSDVLSGVLAKQGLRFNVQDGVLQIYPVGGSPGGEAVLLNSGTGLVGSPLRKDKGIEVTSLLQARIRPGALIRLDSENVKGTFVCEKVIHEGDTWGQEFYSKIELEIGGVA